MKIKNNKAFVLVPMMIMILVLVVIIYLSVQLKNKESIIKSQEIYEWIISDVESPKEDSLAKSRNWQTISNIKLTSLWKEQFDDWTENLFNTIEWLNKTEWNAADSIQYLDRLITNKTNNLTFLWDKDKKPSKINNVFELDLTKFIDNDNNVVGNLSNITINWWTELANTPDIYVIMGRMKKNTIINLDNFANIDVAQNIVAWDGTPQFWKSSSVLDSYSFDYIKLNGWDCSSGEEDKDYGFYRCKRIGVNDFLSNDDFDLNGYFYKVFLVFWFTDTQNESTPFKVTSSDWIFWVWNFQNIDATILTPNNTKRRILIKTSTKNNILPYLIYSLWVRGEINMDWNDS